MSTSNGKEPTGRHNDVSAVSAVRAVGALGAPKPPGALARLLGCLRLDKRHRADRVLLESSIFPWLLADRSIHRVVFVGCAWYTQRYWPLFHEHALTTIDPSPRAARHGARRHIVAPLQDLSDHLEQESQDAIIVNGVLGWGLNDPREAERAFAASHAVLRAAGVLVVGWNDTPRRCGRVLMRVPALARFERVRCPPLAAHQVITQTANRHTFTFFRKPLVDPARAS